MMKAYHVQDRKGYSDYSCVVFAESRGKAISTALGTDEFPSCDWYYTELKATRLPKLDAEYRGHAYMDWYDSADRLALVRYAGYRCEEPDPDWDCSKCIAKDECEVYADLMEELKEYEKET